MAYSGGNEATDSVGTYADAIGLSAATGGTFTASNYTITYVDGDLTVDAASLTITATAQSKPTEQRFQAERAIPRSHRSGCRIPKQWAALLWRIQEETKPRIQSEHTPTRSVYRQRPAEHSPPQTTQLHMLTEILQLTRPL